MIASKFFEFYKNTNIILKLLLLVFVPIFIVLWIIGSLAHFDRLAMFLIGAIGGFIVVYIFYPEISVFINQVIEIVKGVINT